jgi:hypothetical protein
MLEYFILSISKAFEVKPIDVNNKLEKNIISLF